MCDKPSSTYRRGTSILSRCFWLLMCLAHAPAIVSVWEAYVQGGTTSNPLVGCTAVTACMLFFVLKILDVPFLRLNLDRRALVVVVLAVGLIHYDCLGSAADSAAVANCVAIIATTSLAGGLILLARARGHAPQRHARSSVAPILLGRFTGNNLLDETRPCCWVLALGLFRLRAPPA